GLMDAAGPWTAAWTLRRTRPCGRRLPTALGQSRIRAPRQRGARLPTASTGPTTARSFFLVRSGRRSWLRQLMRRPAMLVRRRRDFAIGDRWPAALVALAE